MVYSLAACSELDVFAGSFVRLGCGIDIGCCVLIVVVAYRTSGEAKTFDWFSNSHGSG